MKYKRRLQTPKYSQAGSRPEIPMAGFNTIDENGKCDMRIYRQENGAIILLDREGIPLIFDDEEFICKIFRFLRRLLS